MAHVVPPTKGNPFSAGSGLVSLAPHACGRLYVGGNVYANLIGGGIFVNSDNSGCAADGGSEAFFLYTPSMNVVGGVDPKLSGSSGLTVSPGPSQVNNVDAAIGYPPTSLGFPKVPTCKNADGTNIISTIDPDQKTWTDSDGIEYDVYKPGQLNGIPNGNIYFEFGIFCITIDKKTNINNNQHLTNAPGGVLLF